MKRIFNSKNFLTFSCLLLVFVCGLVLGLKVGYTNGTQNTTEIRNQMFDIRPYDASLQVNNLEYSDISPSGFTVHFDTNNTIGKTIEFDAINGLVCEWTVYPSDIFLTSPITLHMLHQPSLSATIDKYPEGGTVMFRIIDSKRNYGSLWFYIDLPRPDDAILPPPYMPK